MAPGFGTPSVAFATTPTVISTFFSHFLASHKRKNLKSKDKAAGAEASGPGPEDQLSYDEGLKVVRRFLEFASHHGLEEVQGFTAMRVPTPHWVRRKTVTIPESAIDSAAEVLTKHLDSYGSDAQAGSGLKIVGGEKWWKVRGKELEGEWIEMQKDYLHRKATAAQVAKTVAAASAAESSAPSPTGTASHHLRKHFDPRRQGTFDSVKDGSGANVTGERVLLYIHGGAFFFSSLDTHRYQIQRHARKAGARAFAPAYRLAPQYPFPCGLLDALASYLYLIDPPPGVHAPILPTSIILMGDSAGGGMVLSLLVVIREMGLPMPAGASLISPWVDLTHSMPSIGGDDSGDYIPNQGFHYKPSSTWPPLPGDGVDVTMPDGETRHYDDQIQMYCSNKMLTHPLVSPVNMGSLGGLCPLYISGGGAELLRDEIIYIAHKAASPAQYTPSSHTLAEYPDQAKLINKYAPTKVHLQIYEGCCHVTPTLSFTRTAKYMYRATANFNIWAFTAANKALEHKVKRIAKSTTSRSSTLNAPVSQDSSSPSSPIALSRSDSPVGENSNPPSTKPSTIDLTQPIISSKAASEANHEDVGDLDLESEASTSSDESEVRDPDTTGVVSVKGIEPPFGQDHIVAERVSTHGKIRPFEPIADVEALHPNLRERIGRVHGDGALQRWLAKRAEWDDKYSSSLKKVLDVRRADRVEGGKHGYLTRDLKGENPPLCSLAGLYDQKLAREVGRSVDETSTKTSGAMALWMKMSSKADAEQAGGENLGEIKKNVEEVVKAETEDAARETEQAAA